ncbi:MAG TPA: peptide chain release factor 2 [Negativicutes bacterium]|nr:peptide chain release factor 2 [Negativicutes bacterium]
MWNTESGLGGVNVLADLKRDIEVLGERIEDLRVSLDIAGRERRMTELELRISQDGFWDDPGAAQKVMQQLSNERAPLETYQSLRQRYEDVRTLWEIGLEEQDEDLTGEVKTEISALAGLLEKQELTMLLNGEHDPKNAIITLHPGAGGTESQDWAAMLLRMYTRWAEAREYQVEVLDLLPGDEAGIKSVTLMISGYNAYGYLKAEKGVHRLVRISPFDASGRRHTSFVSLDVMPEIDDDIEIEIDPRDLRVDTFRAGGAGGQHINKTDSAVRLTHLPSGVVVNCQSERSQIQNRERAMRLLKAKLFEREREARELKQAELRGESKEIAWGSQIRSYVFHPYSLVKDHRTNTETGNVQAVMDGELDPFIDAYLRKFRSA